MLKSSDPSSTNVPAVSEVKVYFLQKGMTEQEAEHFFLFYQNRHWLNRCLTRVKTWKPLAYRWISKILKQQPWRFNRSIH